MYCSNLKTTIQDEIIRYNHPNMKPVSSHIRVSIIALAFVACLLSACELGIATPTPVDTTPRPTATSTPAPLGSLDNPLVMGLVVENDQTSVTTAAQALTEQLSASSGYSVTFRTYPTHPDLIDAMRAGQVHISFLQPLTYIYAHRLDLADAALLTNHFGVYRYGSQILANAVSGLAIYFDPGINQNVTDAQTALRQLEGKKPCWVDETSLSGYIVPAAILKQNGVTVQNGTNGMTYTGVIRTLYITGVCDFGATFAISGDPRTSPAVLSDLTDALNRVVVLYRSDPIIPNLNISYAPDLSSDIKENLNLSFLDIVKTSEGKKLLTDTADYDIQALKPMEDTEYDVLRGMVETLDISLWNLLGR